MRFKYLISSALIFLSFNITFSQTQLGNSIFGENDDHFGNDVAISDNGEIIICGAPQTSNQAADRKGYVKVYQYSNDQWVQMGKTLYGTENNGLAGFSVDISGDGKRIVFSDNENLRVFDFINNNWNQVGNSIVTEKDSSKIGWDIAISKDGNTISTTGTKDFPPHAFLEVYELINTRWIQKGKTISQSDTFEYVFANTAISGDGNIIAYSTSENEISIYEFVDNDWLKMGNSINNIVYADFGSHVDMSEDGKTIIIGDRFGFLDSLSVGITRVYEFISGNWIQKGNSMFGTDDGSDFGFDVSISDDGCFLLIGEPNWGLNVPGLIRTFEFNESGWGETSRISLDNLNRNYFGSTVAIAGNENIICAGGFNHYANGNDSGVVGVYRLENSQGINQTNDDFDINIFPNPTEGNLIIDFSLLNNEKIIIHVFSIDGKLIYSSTEISCSIASLELGEILFQSGNYILLIETEEGIFVKEIQFLN